MITIEVEGLAHTFRGGPTPVPVLHDVNLTAEAGDYLSLTGPSGSGKTTLLSVLGGLEAPQEGRVRVAGRDLVGLSSNQLAAFRSGTVGFVFQHSGLLESLTALENVELALAVSGVRHGRRGRAAELLAQLGLADRAAHRPLELSGGERHRVAIARALANRPRILLADEPTGNLDDDTAATVISLLEDLPADHGCTLVVVTHNRMLAARAPRRLRLRSGRLYEEPAAG